MGADTRVDPWPAVVVGRDGLEFAADQAVEQHERIEVARGERDHHVLSRRAGEA